MGERVSLAISVSATGTTPTWAVRTAYDKTAIVKNIYGGLGAAASQQATPISFGYKKAMEPYARRQIQHHWVIDPTESGRLDYPNRPSLLFEIS